MITHSKEVQEVYSWKLLHLINLKTRDSWADGFLRILPHFSEDLSCRTPTDDCFYDELRAKAIVLQKEVKFSYVQTAAWNQWVRHGLVFQYLVFQLDLNFLLFSNANKLLNFGIDMKVAIFPRSRSSFKYSVEYSLSIQYKLF